MAEIVDYAGSLFAMSLRRAETLFTFYLPLITCAKFPVPFDREIHRQMAENCDGAWRETAA